MSNGFEPLLGSFGQRTKDYLKRHPELRPEDILQSVDLEFDLSEARTNFLIEQPGDLWQVTYLDGAAYFKINKISAYPKDLRVFRNYRQFGGWDRLYLTNTAQAGKKLKITIGFEAAVQIQLFFAYLLNNAGVQINPAQEDGNLASILGQLDIKLTELRDALRGTGVKDFTTLDTLLDTKLDIKLTELRDALRGTGVKDFTTLETELAKKIDVATSISEYNLTLTSANTEYSQALPANTKAFEFWAEEANDIRFAFTTGKVAAPTRPYFVLKAGNTYYKENVKLSAVTLYFASATAGVHVLILAWV